MNHGILRQYIRAFIFEALEGPHISNVLSQDLVSREQIGSLADGEDDEMSAHLLEPTITPEECYGPVPPNADDPGVFADPFTKDYHVLPTSTIKRG